MLNAHSRGCGWFYGEEIVTGQVNLYLNSAGNPGQSVEAFLFFFNSPGHSAPGNLDSEVLIQDYRAALYHGTRKWSHNFRASTGLAARARPRIVVPQFWAKSSDKMISNKRRSLGSQSWVSAMLGASFFTSRTNKVQSIQPFRVLDGYRQMAQFRRPRRPKLNLKDSG